MERFKYFLTLFLLIPICSIIAKPMVEKFENWIVAKVTEMSSKNVNLVGNVFFGNLDFSSDKIKVKNVQVFQGIFTDSNFSQRLVNIKATKNQILKESASNSLILLVNCNKEDNLHTIIHGKPSPTLRSDFIRDFDGDGYLDALTTSTFNINKSQSGIWVEVYSLKKNAIIFQYQAKDNWTKADNARKMLFLKNDVVSEKVEVEIAKNNKIKLVSVKKICNGGETVAEIKKNLKTEKSTKFISLNNMGNTKSDNS